MSPFQHGEVFVTNDGAETDLDLGHYERFVRTKLGKKNNLLLEESTRTLLKEKEEGIILVRQFKLFHTSLMK